MPTKEPETKRQESPSDESGLGESGDVTPKSNNHAEADIIVPPDGGWGWVIVGASFLSNMLVDGIVYSCGLLLDPMNVTFNVSKAQMAFVSSLLSGFYLMAGPFVSALANRYGFRKVTMLGAVVASAAFGLSYFATNVVYMYVIYGILGGIGLSMIYIPAVITVGFYFERWRALATGISMCGSGVGTFLFAPLSTKLLQEFDWQGTVLIHAGLILNCIVFGAMFRPLKPVRVQVPTIIEEEENKEEKEKADKLLLLMKVQQKSDSGFIFPIEMQNKTASPHTWMGVAPNESYPTAAEVFKKSLTDLEMRRSSANSAVLKAHVQQVNGHGKPRFLTVPVREKDETQDDANENDKNENTVPLLNQKSPNNLEVNEDSSTEGRRHTVTSRHPNNHNRSRRGTLTDETGVSRPMYREDIFFGGSLKRLDKYNSKTSIGYHMSVTHLPTVADVEEEEQSKFKLCPEAVKRTLYTMLDVSLLVSPSFMLLALSGFFSMLGFFVPIIYITQRALDGGMDASSCVWLVSTIGIANTVGRVLCGVISSFKGVNALWINNLAITIGGIATIFSGISYTPAFQYGYCVVFGVSIACFASLRSILVVELMGLEKLTNAFGLLMMFQGIATIIGAPIAGFFMDLTGSYDVSFYIAGGLYTFSALLCYPLARVTRYERSRAEKVQKKKKQAA